MKQTLFKPIVAILTLIVIGAVFWHDGFHSPLPSSVDWDLESATNLVKNGSFEEGATHWQSQIKMNQDFFTNLILEDIDSVIMPLKLEYIDKPIKITYHPQEFRGDLPKSKVSFSFFSKDNQLQSRLTYLLNGTDDHWTHINTMADGVSYITLNEDTKINQVNEITFESILADQNQGAHKINAPPLKKEAIEKIEVTLGTWFYPVGSIFVTHNGWKPYIDESADDYFIDFGSSTEEALTIKTPLMKEVILSQEIPVKKDKSYWVMTDVKKEVGVDAPEMRIQGGVTGANYLSHFAEPHLAQNGWVRMGGIFKPQESKITLQLVASNGGDDIHRIAFESHDYNNVQLIELPPMHSSQLASLEEEILRPKVLKGHKKISEQTYRDLQIPIYDLYFDEGKFYSGELRQIKDRNQSALLKHEGQEYRVRISLRGDTDMHYLAPTKSFRIDFRNPAHLNGKSEINLLRPLTRDFIHEKYSNFIANKLGLIVPEDQFVFLRVNDRPYALMYEAEQWSNEMLEKNQRPIGDLYNDEAEGIHHIIYKKILPAYWSKYTQDPSITKADKTNILLWVHFMNLDFWEGFKSLLNRDQLIASNVHALITGSIHQTPFHNNRPYFNSTLGTFEFIPWDMKYQHRQIGDVRVNPFMDFALKDIAIFNQRNKVLWEYLSNEKNLQEDNDYYQALFQKTKTGFLATTHYQTAGGKVRPYEDVEKFIEGLQKKIKPHRQKIRDLLKKNVPIKVTLKKANESQIAVEIEPQDSSMFSSIRLQSENPVYNQVIPSRFHYETYINTAPHNIAQDNFENLLSSEFLTEEEKAILKSNYKFSHDLNRSILTNTLDKKELKTIFRKIEVIPDYAKTTFLIEGNIKNSAQILRDMNLKAFNATTDAPLTINYQVQLLQNPTTLQGIQTTQTPLHYQLNLDYLQKPIELQYHPQKFWGPAAKSTVYFEFFDKEGNRKSRLTYVLNGSKDHFTPSNRIEGGVSYVTYLRRHRLGQVHELTFENILIDQNKGARRFGAEVLKKEDIGKVEVRHETWFNKGVGPGSIEVSYGSWEKYTQSAKKKAMSFDINWQFTTFESVFQAMEKIEGVNLEPYQHLPLTKATQAEFQNKYPFIIKDERKLATYHLPVGIHKIKETLIIPQGITLIIDPGATLKFSPQTSLIAYGKLRAVGTQENPITFTSLPLRSWGVVGLIQGDSNGQFEHCIFENGGQAHINGVYFSGMLSAYHTNATVKNSIFRGAGRGGGDDALNFKNGHFIVKDSLFEKNHFDAIDFDFADEGSFIQGSTFIKNGNDAIDISGSIIEVSNNQIIESGDKGISIGENSQVILANNNIQKSTMGIAAKDSSVVKIINHHIASNKVGVAGYNKKPIFGGVDILVANSIFENNDQDFGIEMIEEGDSRFGSEVYKSLAVAYNSKYQPTNAVTKEVIKEPKNRTLSKKSVFKDYVFGNFENVGYQFAILINQVQQGSLKENPYPDLTPGINNN